MQLGVKCFIEQKQKHNKVQGRVQTFVNSTWNVLTYYIGYHDGQERKESSSQLVSLANYNPR